MIGVVVVVLFAVLVVFGARGDGAPPFDLAPPEPGAQDSQSPGSQRTVHASPGREESRARGPLRADPRSSAYTGFNADIRTRETLAAERGRTRGAASSEWFATWLTDVSTCGPKVVTDWEWVTRVAPRDPPRRLVRDAREAEEHAAAWVRALGWADAQPTQFSVDGGLDVISQQRGGVGAQVKFEAKPVGSPALQQAVGASLGQGLQTTLFFASAGFTPAALDFAEKVRAHLFRFTFDGDIEPSNGFARELFEARGVDVKERQGVKREVARVPGRVSRPELSFARALPLNEFLQAVSGLAENAVATLVRELRLTPTISLAELTEEELVALKDAIRLRGRRACWGEAVPKSLRKYRRLRVSMSMEPTSTDRLHGEHGSTSGR